MFYVFLVKSVLKLKLSTFSGGRNAPRKPRGTHHTSIGLLVLQAIFLKAARSQKWPKKSFWYDTNIASWPGFFFLRKYNSMDNSMDMGISLVKCCIIYNNNRNHFYLLWIQTEKVNQCHGCTKKHTCIGNHSHCKLWVKTRAVCLQPFKWWTLQIIFKHSFDIWLL